MSTYATQAQAFIALGGLISQLAAMLRKLERKRSDKQGNTDASKEAKVAKYLRPDVTARHAANANTEVTVVKTSLNSFCKDKGKALPWEDVLLDLNKAVLEAKQAYVMLRDIVESEYKGEDLRVLLWRIRIPRQSNSKVDHQPHLLLPVMYTFLACIEEHNRLNQRTPGFVKVRAFSLLLFKKGFVSSHFKMCKTGLRALLQLAGQKAPGAGSERNAGINATWRELFNIDKFETASHKFAGENLTDEKSVSVVLRKLKYKSTT